MNMETAGPAAAVIVIDLQTGMFDGVAGPPIHGASGLVERTRAIIGWARRTGRKVAFVRHDGGAGDPLAPGLPGWPVWPAMGQEEGEPTFAKSIGDAFSQPALCEWLAEQGTREVILLGAQTDECVNATVKGALERGLTVIVVGDAHSTWKSRGHSAEEIIARHNAAFAARGARVVTAHALTEGGEA